MADVGQLTVAELEQVLGRQSPSGGIVREHGRHRPATVEPLFMMTTGQGRSSIQRGDAR